MGKIFKEVRYKPLTLLTLPKMTSQLITNNMQFSEEAVILEGLRLVGVGLGAVFGAFLMALGRNPNLKDMMFGYLLLGFALTEAIALFALMMAFLILFF